MTSFDKLVASFNTISTTGLTLFKAFEEKLNNAVENYSESAKEMQNKLKKLQKENEENASTTKTFKRNKGALNSTNTSSTSDKPRRMASQVASLMINKQAMLKTNLKMRRPDDEDDIISSQKSHIIQEVIVKVERIEVGVENYAANEISTDNKVVSENKTVTATEMMPPPTSPVKSRGRGRPKKIKSEVDSSDTENESARPVRASRAASKSKKASKQTTAVDTSTEKRPRRKKKGDSDIVILPDAPVPIISLLDSESEGDVIQKHVEQEKVETSENEDNDEEKTDLPKEKDKENNQINSDLENIHTNNKVDQKNNENFKTSEDKEIQEEKRRHKHERSWSSEEDDSKRAKKRTKKVSKKVTTKNPTIERIPFVALENIKQETTVYEDALSVSKDTHIVIPETPKLCDQTYKLAPSSKPQLNETVTVLQVNTINSTFCKDSGMLNSTVTVESANTAPITKDEDLLKKNGFLDCTVTINKNLEISENKHTNDNIEQLVCRVSLEKHPMIENIISNETTTVSKKDMKNVVNETVIIPSKENRQWQEPEPEAQIINSTQPLLTDDESDVSPVKEDKIKNMEKTPKQQIIKESSESSEKDSTPKDKKPKKGVKTKPMFSPYANSPVKKRVAAFEKLGSADKNAAGTTRVTRTKTRKMIEEKENEQKTVSKIPSTMKPNTKYVTPVTNKLKPLLSHTDGRPYRPPALTGTNKPQNISTMSSSSETLHKSQSAIKLTRAELQERREEEQRRRIEKEDDAKRKKDAIMHAKAEESKRIREEKMKKAQQAREEKEKQKEVKLRQLLAEKDEKQKEELERKKAFLAQRAAELEEQRRIAEQNRLQRQKEEEQQNLQWKKQQEEKAKKNKPPPLPTADNYDTDSSDESDRPRVQIPRWGQKSQLFPLLQDMMYIPVNAIHTYYSVRPTTPNLEEIFENIPKNYLRRNSSAVWRTPPRYSQLPKF